MDPFFSTSLETRLARHLTESPQQAARILFHSVAADVPAYRDLLKKEGIDPANIQTDADFKKLPLLTKQNYLLPYPLPQRCRGGTLHGNEMIAVSSGSTGQPLFWPRSLRHELDVAFRFEQIFRDAFQADRRPTLAVICFALGTWVGGFYTAACCRSLTQKGYPITLVTPGNNKSEIFRVVEALGPHFEQVVLAGYPPFIKEVIDQGVAQKNDWKRHSVKLILAGEVFSEEWRNLVCERIGSDDPIHDTASLYGTADAGVLGNETPASIAIRRFFASHPAAARECFGESRLPTLAQYDPLSRFFEVTPEGTLVVTADGGVPLIRYHIADQGGLLSYEAMRTFVKKQGEDPIAELEAQARHLPHPLPFVYLFGRADFTVSYYGANIYPENVTVGLEQAPIQHWVTGKFVLQVRETENQDKVLSVVVELLPGISEAEEKRQAIGRSIRRELLRLNSEFANYVPTERQMPEVSLAPAGDPAYFPAGVKHRYTRRSP
ncbi:MAG: phenylacetate--CoA ligase family protein [Nitrospirae bacterium]|nr:phenylacetate--CoA ligase family protein [Candidatus Manganitrophaceae bacterium]